MKLIKDSCGGYVNADFIREIWINEEMSPERYCVKVRTGGQAEVKVSDYYSTKEEAEVKMEEFIFMLKEE